MHHVSVESLSKEDGESLSIEDLVDGQNVIYEGVKGKTYDVTISMKGIKALCRIVIMISTNRQ